MAMWRLSSQVFTCRITASILSLPGFSLIFLQRLRRSRACGGFASAHWEPGLLPQGCLTCWTTRFSAGTGTFLSRPDQTRSWRSCGGAIPWAIFAGLLRSCENGLSIPR